MKPLGDRLLLRAPPAPEKIGRFWVPPAAQQDFTICQAEIVERGDGVRDIRLQSGARVIVRRFGRVTLEHENAFAVREGDVLAVLDVNAL